MLGIKNLPFMELLTEFDVTFVSWALSFSALDRGTFHKGKGALNGERERENFPLPVPRTMLQLLECQVKFNQTGLWVPRETKYSRKVYQQDLRCLPWWHSLRNVPTYTYAKVSTDKVSHLLTREPKRK